MPLSPNPAEKGTLPDALPQQLLSPTAQSAVREDALRQAPGMPVVMLRSVPVKVGSIRGHATAYTVTHVLVEWDHDGEYHARWVTSWLVRRL